SRRQLALEAHGARAPQRGERRGGIAPAGDHHAGDGATGGVEAQRAREGGGGLAVRPGPPAEAVRRRAGLVVAVGAARAAGSWVVGVMTDLVRAVGVVEAERDGHRGPAAGGLVNAAPRAHDGAPR